MFSGHGAARECRHGCGVERAASAVFVRRSPLPPACLLPPPALRLGGKASAPCCEEPSGGVGEARVRLARRRKNVGSQQWGTLWQGIARALRCLPLMLSSLRLQAHSPGRRGGRGWRARHASMQLCVWPVCFFCPRTHSLARYAPGTPAHDGDGGGGGAGRPSHNKEVKLDELSKYFHLPEKAVAKELGICLTSLKKLCRCFPTFPASPAETFPPSPADRRTKTHTLTLTHTHQARLICLVA